jgi:putative PEP-CTERM system TPR-repeat lipoprotein
LILLILAGCQPAPEEYFARAQQYFAQADYRSAAIELRNAIRGRGDYADARLLLARSAYQLGDLSTAENEFIRALEFGLDEPSVWLGYGRTLVEQGRARDAFESVVPNLEGVSDDADVAAFTGDVLAALGNTDEATRHYDHALALDDSHAAALLGLAVVADVNGDSELARSTLARAKQLHPDSPLVWRAEGDSLRLQGAYPAAAEAYSRSIQSESLQTPLAHRFLARANRTSVLIDAWQLDAAQESLDDMLNILPRHPLIHFLRGRLAYATGDFEMAQTELQEYLAMIPSDLRGQAVLGAVNYSRNYFEQAERYLRQAVRQNVGGDVTRRLLAETQLRLRKPADALAILDEAAVGASDDPALLAMLGRAQIGLGNTDSAISYFEQSVAGDPTNPAASLSLAVGLLAAGEFDRAVEVLEAAPQADDDQFRRESLLIAAHLKNDNLGAAVAETNKLIEEHPENSAAYFVAGVLRHSIGEATTASIMFRRAIDLDETNLGALYGLGLIAEEESDTASALEWYNRVLDINAAYPPALISLSRILHEANRYHELQSRFEAATVADERALAPRLLHARVAILNGDYEGALDSVEAAYEWHPENPKLRHAEGLAMTGRGQVESGLRILSIAASDAPDDATIQYDFARVSLQQQDFRNARIAGERLQKLQPGNASALALLVEALAKSGDIAGARRAVSNHQQQYGAEALTYLLAGDLDMMEDDPVAARQNYEAAAQLHWSRATVTRLAGVYQAIAPSRAAEPLRRWLQDHPEDTPMRRIYAQVLENTGESTAAAEQYEKVIIERDDDPIALNNLAWSYAEQGRREAVDLARRAHEIAPNNGDIADTYGWILFQQGDLDLSLELLRKAANLSSDNPEIQYHLASVLAAAGRAEESQTLLNRLLQEYPEFPSRDKAEALVRTL